MLSEDVPFKLNTVYQQYLPNVPESELYAATWAWLTPLVEKIKNDLIALGRWDRQCYHDYQCMLWDHECVGVDRACSTHTLARASGDVGAFQLCCSMLGRTAQGWTAQ